MNQHSQNVGSFDPNKNEYQNVMQHVIYDQSIQQPQHQLQHQQSFAVHGYDVAGTSEYLPHNQQMVHHQPMVSSGIVAYSSAPQVSIVESPAYFDPNQPLMQHQMTFEQHSPVAVAQAGNSMSHQHYYCETSGPSTQQGGYTYYVSPGREVHAAHDHFGQMTREREYSMPNTSSYAGVTAISNTSTMGQIQQMRPQPMTLEQLQLSQQRLLGFAVPLRQEQPQSQASPQFVQRPQQQMQLHPQHPTQLQPQGQVHLQQHQPPPQQVHHQLHPQQHQQQTFLHQPQLQHQPQSQHPTVSSYEVPQYSVPAPVSSQVAPAPVPSRGSPAGSSHTSSTDISDECDELFGGPAPYKRSPPSDTASKRQGKKRKLQKDPNEPQKPVSAYALFFRDMQASIKGQNPAASFGDVSKIVASMWDNLDNDGKNSYKQKTEVAKKDYLKQLAAYRANLLSKGNRPAGKSISDGQYQQQQTPSIRGQLWTSQAATDMEGKSLASLISEPKLPQLLATTTTSVAMQQSSAPSRSAKPEPILPRKDEGICIRAGCQNPAVECSQWDGEYCTDACVSKNCRNVFTAWVKSKQQHQRESDAVAPS